MRPGQTIDVDTAIRAIVIRSANDVAVVIAEALGGTELHFAEMMTEKARQLGMKDTNYHNASGLPDPLQITTANDLAVLAHHLGYDFPQYFPYFLLPGFTYKGVYYPTHDNLIGRYQGADGIKTGYTGAARERDRALRGIATDAHLRAWDDRELAHRTDDGRSRRLPGSTRRRGIRARRRREGGLAHLARERVECARSRGPGDLGRDWLPAGEADGRLARRRHRDHFAGRAGDLDDRRRRSDGRRGGCRGRGRQGPGRGGGGRSVATTRGTAGSVAAARGTAAVAASRVVSATRHHRRRSVTATLPTAAATTPRNRTMTRSRMMTPPPAAAITYIRLSGAFFALSVRIVFGSRPLDRYALLSRMMTCDDGVLALHRR